MDKKPPVTKHL